MKNWKRNCPKCNEEIFYTRKYERNRAEKVNAKCKSCIKKGIIFSEEHKKKLSEAKGGENHPLYGKFGEDNPNYGKKRFFTKDHKKNISESHKGIKFTDERKKNMRIAAIKRIEKQKGQCMPNYNLKAISIIREKAKEYNITDLQHAENDGEFQVCGYFVDGYSPSKNVVIEYYEKKHKYQKERDERRKQEIVNELGCKFIEIREQKL